MQAVYGQQFLLWTRLDCRARARCLQKDDFLGFEGRSPEPGEEGGNFGADLPDRFEGIRRGPGQIGRHFAERLLRIAGGVSVAGISAVNGAAPACWKRCQAIQARFCRWMSLAAATAPRPTKSWRAFWPPSMAAPTRST